MCLISLVVAEIRRTRQRNVVNPHHTQGVSVYYERCSKGDRKSQEGRCNGEGFAEQYF